MFFLLDLLVYYASLSINCAIIYFFILTYIQIVTDLNISLAYIIYRNTYYHYVSLVGIYFYNIYMYIYTYIVYRLLCVFI